MTSSDVRVDVIVNGLKELQQEKSRLELKLGDLRRQKSVLERNVEVLTSRRSQSTDVNSKLRETLRVAQTKVGQTQAQLDSLQEILNAKRETNLSLSKEVEGLKNAQLAETSVFEQDLVKLTEMFVEAKQFYDEQNLQEKISQTEDFIDAMKKNTEESEKRAADLAENFERLTLEMQNEEDEMLSLPLAQDDQIMVYNLFSDEREAAKAAFNDLSIRKEKLQKELQELNAQDAAN